ncbi:MAG: sugar ABC transporter ATP-binding protein [Armatimonadetes bacterium]|nr:sugar ABC transporter ATP-binding protein [Armatimonadota bacterium]
MQENRAVFTQETTGLQASGVNLSFGEFRVLDSVSLTLTPGSIHAITGENGAGKSSLAKVIAGLYEPDSASILLNGEELHIRSPREGLALGIALIHQEPLTFPDLTIFENILAGNLPTRRGIVDWASAKERSRELLQQLGSSLDVERVAGDLSIADQQMLELAAALSHDAKVWIFDETTAPLTPKEIQRIFKIMRELRDKGRCIAIVTHHLDEVFDISDEISVLRGGVNVAHLRTAETTQAEVVRHMVGRDIANGAHSGRHVDGEVALRVENLTGADFHDVNFEVRRGEVFGIAGLVGAGRTELAQAIFGVTPWVSGKVELFQQSYKPTNPGQAIGAGVQLVPEDRRGAGLMLERSILENAALTSLSFFANRVGMVSAERERDSIVPVLERLRTALRSPDQHVGELSGGNQQKVVLAKALVEPPRLIIFDEPTRGVDIGAKEDVHKLIIELADSGIAVILISSDLPEVLSLSDRIGVMRRGTIAGVLGQSEATHDSVIALASGGTQS